MSIINLLPDDYVIRRQQSRANVLCTALFVVVMAGVVGAALVSEESFGHTRDILVRVNADYEEAAKLLAELQQLEQQKRAMLAKAQTTNGLQERVPRSYLLGLITNSLPEGASVVDMTLQVKQVITRAIANKKSEPAAPTIEFDVRGMAGTDVDVAKFIATVARNPLVASVDLVYSQEKLVEKVAVREFQIHAELRPGVDVIEAMDKQAAEPKASEALARAAGGGA